MRLKNLRTGDTYEVYEDSLLGNILGAGILIFILAFPFLFMGYITYIGGISDSDLANFPKIVTITFKFLYFFLYIPNLLVPLPFINHWSIGDSAFINNIFRGFMSLLFVGLFYGLIYGIIKVINNFFSTSIKALYVILIFVYVPFIIMLIGDLLFLII